MYLGVAAAAAEFFLRFLPDQRTISACRLPDTEAPRASVVGTVGDVYPNQRHFYANACWLTHLKAERLFVSSTENHTH